jgi:hypothetical protein
MSRAATAAQRPIRRADASAGNAARRQQRPRTQHRFDCCAASTFLGACRSWVKTSRQNMSATASAFAGSGHGGAVPMIAPNTARARWGRLPRAALRSRQHAFWARPLFGDSPTAFASPAGPPRTRRRGYGPCRRRSTAKVRVVKPPQGYFAMPITGTVRRGAHSL